MIHSIPYPKGKTMKATKTLWIDGCGKLVDEAPGSGVKIAASKGDEIHPRIAAKYGLEVRDGGEITQLEQPEEKDGEITSKKGKKVK